MTDSGKALVPVWTLATQDMKVPVLADDALTPERLGELRTVLAAMAEAPIVTLEAHPLPKDLDQSKGLRLDAASPLATHLSQLIKQTSKSAPKAALGADTETLYRMVVPAKVASQVGSGLVKPMASNAAPGGVHSALTGSAGIVAQASFTPVTAGEVAAVGGTAAGAAVGVGALTVAAPLVLMAVAVGVSAHAEQERRQAIEKITSMLETLHDDNLQRERSALNGCRAAVEKATAILLDHGEIGDTVGLPPAVHAIETAIADAETRLKKWEDALIGFGEGVVEIAQLKTQFDGIDNDQGGRFRAHLDLAELAIALKKRVLVLQAVEHAQKDEFNPFESFVRALKADQRRVTELESGIGEVLQRLSSIKLSRPRRRTEILFSRGEVDALLNTSYRLRDLARGVKDGNKKSDVAIEMVRSADGSLVVLPAAAVA
jgi:hypothetical protein